MHDSSPMSFWGIPHKRRRDIWMWMCLNVENIITTNNKDKILTPRNMFQTISTFIHTNIHGRPWCLVGDPPTPACLAFLELVWVENQAAHWGCLFAKAYSYGPTSGYKWNYIAPITSWFCIIANPFMPVKGHNCRKMMIKPSHMMNKQHCIAKLVETNMKHVEQREFNFKHTDLYLICIFDL